MGVPTFAVLYHVAELIVNSKLERKNLPASSRMYDPVSYVDNEGHYMSGREEEKMENIVEEIVEDLEKESKPGEPSGKK